MGAALKRIDSGDKILLAEGRHFLGDSSFLEKDVRIEGIGQCDVSLRHTDNDDDIDIVRKVSLSNIRIMNTWASMHVDQQGILWMTDCVFHGSSCLDVSGKGRLDVLRVQFVGTPDNRGAIYGSGSASISAQHCSFDGCGGGENLEPCIAVP